MKANTPPMQHRAWDGKMMNYRDYSHPYLKCDPRRLMYYIGVKDINGGRIYEGDVLEISCCLSLSNNRTFIDTVLWKGGDDPSFDILNREAVNLGNGINAYSEKGVAEIKIIGNIFEQPHYLKLMENYERFGELRDRFGASLKYKTKANRIN